MATEHAAPGAPSRRIDGATKVKGEALYAGDQLPPQCAYAALVGSTVAHATVASVDAAEAWKVEGVVLVLWADNAPKLKPAATFPLGAASRTRLPLHDHRVTYVGESIAVVVANTPEAAQEGAKRVKVTYTDVTTPKGRLDDVAIIPANEAGTNGRINTINVTRGDAEKALAGAALTLDATYSTSRLYHAAMEPHATVVEWRGEELVVYEGSQWVAGARDVLATWFERKPEQVRVVSPFVGGGFGSRISLLPHVAIAAMASQRLGRPVKLVLTRPQCFATVGHRPATRHRMRLGARSDATLVALLHDNTNETAEEDLYVEGGPRVTKSLYAVEHYRSECFVGKLDIVPPCWMRAPGEAVGSFAMECAIDEMAAMAGVDPLAMRILNDAERDPDGDKPWSSRHLREAYEVGSRVIGWERRAPVPRSRKEGHEWIGLGMAVATQPVYLSPAEAKLVMHADGTVHVDSGGVDIGQGTYTTVALLVAGVLSIGVERVMVRLGDSTFARAPVAGGSQLASSLGAAVEPAAMVLRERLIVLAVNTVGSPFLGHATETLGVAGGNVVMLTRPAARISFEALMKLAKRASIEAEHRTHPTFRSRVLGDQAFASFGAIRPPAAGGTSSHSWGAHFVEVAVDEELGTIRVRRMVGAFDCGRVLSPVTARSQLMGAMVMGLGMALTEGGHVDGRSAKVVNGDFGEYLLPTQADVPEQEVLFVGAPDLEATPLGSKAIGELGIVGVAAAVANAVYHATGTRLRDLPLRLR